ncbi:uncharacterized protein LOC125082917 isoform X2 [Lutra lutra]|uniref:uncharacterized protein LOC125082917 isoform X2 n=1 Tax=Lutra lutra TaxID=9657 RepID=UPI001FD422B5|nr:uncharacterized protein LOC125082917 isoform X2 [Lutra lutra]
MDPRGSWGKSANLWLCGLLLFAALLGFYSNVFSLIPGWGQRRASQSQDDYPAVPQPKSEAKPSSESDCHRDTCRVPEVPRLSYPNAQVLNPTRGDVLVMTPWFAPIVWDGVFDSTVLDAQFRNTTIGLTVFAIKKSGIGPTRQRCITLSYGFFFPLPVVTGGPIYAGRLGSSQQTLLLWSTWSGRLSSERYFLCSGLSESSQGLFLLRKPVEPTVIDGANTWRVLLVPSMEHEFLLEPHSGFLLPGSTVTIYILLENCLPHADFQICGQKEQDLSFTVTFNLSNLKSDCLKSKIRLSYL